VLVHMFVLPQAVQRFGVVQAELKESNTRLASLEERLTKAEETRLEKGKTAEAAETVPPQKKSQWCRPLHKTTSLGLTSGDNKKIWSLKSGKFLLFRADSR
jgi:hypothetical protein